VRVRQNKANEVQIEWHCMRVKGKNNCQKAKKIVADTGKMALGEGQTEQSK
jgi:hypothetical protein